MIAALTGLGPQLLVAEVERAQGRRGRRRLEQVASRQAQGPVGVLAAQDPLLGSQWQVGHLSLQCQCSVVSGRVSAQCQCGECSGLR